MPKIPKFTSYTELKQQIQEKMGKSKKIAEEKIKDANDYISEKAKNGAKKAANWVDEKVSDSKIKETAQKAADWTGERIDDVKDAYERVKQGYEQFTMERPKLEILGEKVTELQKQVLFKSAFLSELKRRAPQENILIFQKEKELMSLEQKAQQAINEYKKFAEKQAAAQRAFDRLNGFNK